MTTINLNERIKKIVTDWHDDYLPNNEDAIKILKEFPIMKIVNACIDKMSATIRAQVLSACENDVLKHVNRIKEIENDTILRQSTLLSKLGLLDSRACEITKKLENQKRTL